MRAGRWTQWIVPIVLIGGTLLWLRLALKPRTQLTERSTLLTDARDWRCEYTGYFWKSADEVLFLRETGQTALRLFVRNVRTGQETALTALDNRLNIPTRRHNTQTWRLSPDGNWLLTISGGRKTAPIFEANSLDGRQKRAWPIGIGTEFSMFWFPDSRRWLELRSREWGAQPILHTLDGRSMTGQKIKGPRTWPLGITNKGRLVDVEQSATRVTLYEYGLEPEAGPALQNPVPLPRGSRIQEAEPSPDGTRMAYLTVAFRSSPVRYLFRGLFPTYTQNANPRYTLWVSSTDGSGLKEVGIEDSADITGIQWTPDGKRLSFFARRTLRTIPADDT